MDTIHRQAFSATCHDAGAVARRLRQADTLPLSKLCDQIRKESYQEWLRWDKSLDWADTLHGRYGLSLFPEYDTAAPTSDPDTLPLWQHAQDHPEQYGETEMDLLRITVTKDARIDNAELRQKACNLGLPEALDILPSSRSRTDNVRHGLREVMRQWAKFEQDGAECMALAESTKSGKGLDMRINVKHRSTGTVRYTSSPIASISGDNGESDFTVQLTVEGRQQFPKLCYALNRVDNMERFGESHYFESDLRRLCEQLLEGACLPLWSGLRLILTEDGRTRVRLIQELLGVLDAGYVRLSMLSLDNTPANREALARELGEGFTAQLETLLERCGYEPPNVPAITKEYGVLQARLALAEEVLGIEIPCFEVQAQLEMKLDSLSE